MNKPNKDIFDRIDEVLSGIDGEEIARTITEKVDQFSQTISDSIEDSINHKEYSRNTKPKFSKYLDSATSRINYVLDIIQKQDISNTTYTPSYKEGYDEALRDIKNVLNDHANDLDVLDRRIQAQVKEIKLRTSQYKKSYVNGYIQGCELIQKAIKRSKRYMMDKILSEMI